jgi:hypothetical protein
MTRNQINSRTPARCRERDRHRFRAGSIALMLSRHCKRMTPPQTGKAREIAVSRDQLAAVLDGQGGDVRVGNERSLDAAAKVDEHVPMPAARRDERRPGPVHQTLAEGDAVSIGVGGSKIRGFVTMRRKPASTTSDSANGSSEAVKSRSQAA